MRFSLFLSLLLSLSLLPFAQASEEETPLVVRIAVPALLQEESEIPVVRIFSSAKKKEEVPCVAATEAGKKMCDDQEKEIQNPVNNFKSISPPLKEEQEETAKESDTRIPDPPTPSFSPEVSEQIFPKNAAEQGALLSQEWGVFRPSIAKTSFEGVQLSGEMTQMLSDMSGARSGVFMASHIAEIPANTEDLFVQRMLLLREMKHISELKLAQEVQNAHDRFSRFEEMMALLDDILFRSQQELIKISGEQEFLKNEIQTLSAQKKVSNEAFFSDFAALSTESIEMNFSQVLSSKKGLTERETYFSRNGILQENMTKLHSYIGGQKVLLQQNREALLLGMPIAPPSTGILDFIQ